MAIPRLDDRSTTDPGRTLAMMEATRRGAANETAMAKLNYAVQLIRDTLPEVQNPTIRDRFTMMLAVSEHDPSEPGTE